MTVVRRSPGSGAEVEPAELPPSIHEDAPVDKLHVVITMDVEPPTSGTHPAASGPKSWADSDRFIRGYAERAAEFGFPVTFFIHPEVAVEQAGLFAEMKERGGCVEGLHLHPWKFRDGKYRAHFGGLGERDMRAAVSEAISMWQSGMGRRPLYFRPGTFSGNDFMYQVLADLGFRGGSCSIPGRIWPRMNAIWTGAALDPHRAHPTFRQLVGNLPFANMPVAVDVSGTVVTAGTRFRNVDPASASLASNTVVGHWDMRPDWREADYERIAANIVHQVRERGATIPVINSITHNDNDFTDPEDRVCRNFVRAMRAMTDAARAVGMEPAGSTMETVADLVLAEPDRSLEFVYT